jgi:hypothetical protein
MHYSVLRVTNYLGMWEGKRERDLLIFLFFFFKLNVAIY